MTPLHDWLTQLRQSLQTASDAQLLADYLHTGAEDAFAALVQRHQQMVFGVCRRVLANHADAEDAFQATFLVFVKKAHTITPHALVGHWLYGVAYRTALRAKATRAKRLVKERTACHAETVEATTDDFRAMLDQELSRLPEKYRWPIILCDLEGRSQREVAQHFAWPEGTVATRLRTARQKLAHALRRRGVELTVTALVARLADEATATATHGLRMGIVSPTAHTLAATVVQGLAYAKMRFVAAVACGMLAMVSGFAWRPTPPIEAAPLTKVAEREGEIVVWRAGTAFLFKPDGTKVHSWLDEVPEPGGFQRSPDGKTLAVLRPYETRVQNKNVGVGGGAQLPGMFKRHLYAVTLYPVGDKLKGTDLKKLGASVERVLWSSDGKKLYMAVHADDENTHDVDLKHYVYDVATAKHEELKLPAGHHLYDVSTDGQFYLTRGPQEKPTSAHPACLVPTNGGKHTVLNTETEAFYDGRFSPDGKRLLLCGYRQREGWLATVPVADPTKRTNLLLAEREYANMCSWSPDGKRVVTARQVQPLLNQPAEQKTIVLSDPDGRNRKTLTDDTGKFLEPVFVHWR